MKKRKIVYIDLDGVCADFDTARDNLPAIVRVDGECNVPEHFFTNLAPMEGAIESVYALAAWEYDVYFLSTPQWSNPNCWREKRLWVEQHYGALMFKRLILTHNKGLLKGDYLIDDRLHNGVEEFEGIHIHFGSEKFPNWKSVLEYFATARAEEVMEGIKEQLHDIIDDTIQFGMRVIE